RARPGPAGPGPEHRRSAARIARGTPPAAGRAGPGVPGLAPARKCPPPQPCNWSGPGTHGRPSDISAAKPARGRARPANPSGPADHPPAVPAFRKLDAVAVLTARLLPALHEERL